MLSGPFPGMLCFGPVLHIQKSPGQCMPVSCFPFLCIFVTWHLCSAATLQGLCFPCINNKAFLLISNFHFSWLLYSSVSLIPIQHANYCIFTSKNYCIFTSKRQGYRTVLLIALVPVTPFYWDLIFFS